MKKILLLILAILLSACSSNDESNHRDVVVVVKDITCRDGRLYSDDGCILITDKDEKYTYGTDLINLNKGQEVVLTVKGFNKIKKIRYNETILE